MFKNILNCKKSSNHILRYDVDGQVCIKFDVVDPLYYWFWYWPCWEKQACFLNLEDNLVDKKRADNTRLGVKTVCMKNSLRGHSTTTWTEFCHFFIPPPFCVHSFYTLSVDKNRHFLTPSLPSSCPRSNWMAPNLFVSENIYKSTILSVSSSTWQEIPKQ